MSGIGPVEGVPMVRVVNEHGKELFRGWCIRHEARRPAPFGGELRDEDVQHIVAVDSPADWNMPRNLKLLEVKPPYRIEAVDE